MTDSTAQVEVLKIARDLLMDEYVERVNQLEQRWAAESALNWRAYQKVIPYPTLPAPPSVADILDTAQMLLEFFNGAYTAPTEPTPPTEPQWGNVAPGNVTPMHSNVVPENVVPANTLPMHGEVTVSGNVVTITPQ